MTSRVFYGICVAGTLIGSVMRVRSGEELPTWLAGATIIACLLYLWARGLWFHIEQKARVVEMALQQEKNPYPYDPVCPRDPRGP